MASRSIPVDNDEKIKSIMDRIERKKADQAYFTKEKHKGWQNAVADLEYSIENLTLELNTRNSIKDIKNKSNSLHNSIEGIKKLKQMKLSLIEKEVSDVSYIDEEIGKLEQILRKKLKKINEAIKRSGEEGTDPITLRRMIHTSDVINEVINDDDSKSKHTVVSKSKSKPKHTAVSKSKSKPKSGYKHEYGDWSQVIYELQQRHPRLGDIPLTWYQANPDGNCFFISVDAVLRNDRNVHNVYKNSARILRNRVVDSMDSLLGENAAIAYEMNSQLPPDFGRLSVAPSSVTSTLLKNYKRYMTQDSSWAGQLELTMSSRILNRPIIVFYNNSNSPTIIWHDERHQCPYRNNSQLSGEPEPIILGHIPKTGTGPGKHYIYALYERVGGSLKKKKNKTKKRKNTKRKNTKRKNTKRKNK